MPHTTISIHWQQLKVTLLVAFILLATHWSLRPKTPSNSATIGQHYARLVTPYLFEHNTAQLNVLLKSFVADPSIIKSAIYTVRGEQVTAQGQLLPTSTLVRRTPTISGHRLPLQHNQQVIGYLQWLGYANNSR